MNTSAPGIQHPYRRQVKDIGGSENTPHPFRWIVPSYNYILSEINPSLKGDEQHKLCLVENTGFLYRLVQAFPPQWDFVFKLDVNTVPSLVKALDDIQALYETKTNQSEFNLMVNAIHQINATLTTCITNDRIVNHLGANEPGLVLSAAQGRILKGMIDDINVILGVEGGSIVSLHEIVQYIELNREMLETLSVDNIVGLNDELNARVRHTDLVSIYQSISSLQENKLDSNLIAYDLNTTDENKVLSALQGYLLRDRLETIENITASDDPEYSSFSSIVSSLKDVLQVTSNLSISTIPGLQAHVDSLEMLSLSVTDINANYTDIRDSVQELETIVDTHNLSISSLETEIAHVRDIPHEFTSLQADTNSAIDQINSQLYDAMGAVDRFSVEVNELLTLVNDNTTGYTTLNNRLTAHESDTETKFHENELAFDAVNLALTNLENTLTLNINTLSGSTDTRFLAVDQTISDLDLVYLRKDAPSVSSVVTSNNGTIDLRLGNSFRLTGLPMGTSHPISVIKPDLTDKVMSVTIMIDNQLDLEWPSDITWVETPILGPNYTMVVLAVYEDRTIGQVIVTA